MRQYRSVRQTALLSSLLRLFSVLDTEVIGKLGHLGATFGKDKGTGFGLYYARIMLERWGGYLRLESAPNKGTVVTLTLKTV